MGVFWTRVNISSPENRSPKRKPNLTGCHLSHREKRCQEKRIIINVRWQIYSCEFSHLPKICICEKLLKFAIFMCKGIHMIRQPLTNRGQQLKKGQCQMSKSFRLLRSCLRTPPFFRWNLDTFFLDTGFWHLCSRCTYVHFRIALYISNEQSENALPSRVFSERRRPKPKVPPARKKFQNQKC